VEEVKNIVVRMPNWLGDLVMATPVLRDLRRRYPHAHITAMCQGGIGSLLENSPYINEVMIYEKPTSLWRRAFGSAGVTDLKHGRYDLGVLLTNSFSTAWLLKRGRVKRLIGFRGNLRNSLLSEAVPFPENKEQQHLVQVYKEVLAPLGIPLSTSAPELFLSTQERAWAKQFLLRNGWKEGQKIIGVSPVAAFGPAKQWLPERFRELTERLLARGGVHVVFVGDDKGVEQIKQMINGLSGSVSSVAGMTSLRQLVALIGSFDLFVTNDSGPMHLAAACKTPLVALFGSTSEVKTGPYGGGKVIHKHVECSPCYKRVCPIDFRCMKQISVDEVYEVVTQTLS
jgi:heptosyltransferase-2